MKKRKNEIILLFVMIVVFLGLFSSNKSNDNITGDVTAKLIAVVTENGTCNTTLNEGWNLASFYCLEEDMSVENYFKNYTDKIISMHSYDSFGGTDKWKTYNPNLPNWVINDLTNIKKERGYWIKTNESWILQKNGSITKPTQVFLKKGWNLVGYPTQFSKAINESLQIFMASDWSLVYMYNSSDTIDPWKIYILNAPANTTLDLYNFSPRYGYWINTSKTGEWYVNY